MAHVGSGTNPSTSTFPGFATDPGSLGEGPVPEPPGPPTGIPPQSALIVVVNPPAGKGAPIVQECPADLQFTNTAPGGFEAMNCTLDWPDNTPPVGLYTAATAAVIDRRTGEYLWWGHVVDPGYTKTGTGASRRIACQGFQTVLDTQAGAVGYIDRDQSQWRLARDYKAGSAQIVDDISLPQHPQDWADPSLSLIEMDIPEGSRLYASPTRTTMTMTYRPPKFSANKQDIVCIQGTFDGTNDAAYRVKVRVATQAGTVQTVMDRDYGGSPVHFRLRLGAGDWTQVGSRVGQLQWVYDGSGAGLPAPRDYYLRFGNLAVVFDRVNASGATVIDPGTDVTTGDIVHDLCGRILFGDLFIDAAPSAIAKPDTKVEQATWWDGATVRQIMEWVGEIETDYYWAVWEPRYGVKGPDPARFEYRSWLTAPRYIIPPGAAKVELAGGADDLATHALVTYQTSADVPASVVVAGQAPELEAAGVNRIAHIDLTPEGALTERTAKSKGLSALRARNDQRTSGTALVTSPVMDVRTGRMIEPWEIRAGWNVVIADGNFRADGGHPYSLTGSRDGRTTFRCTSAQYFVSSRGMELALDGGGRNLFRRTRIPLPRLRRPARKR
ncbi:hypothetical protein [Kineosporia babensis]|uniref:Uncharacterized protein n=1 Tax=Kineosporia babensis TaxID=499548 RepID=A0A9X1NBQ5_9ACTN|nr:hypothetical protein [Kineosporia babensis]MCD5310789.1 hypothetical protein [Kineosporia babensis]